MHSANKILASLDILSAGVPRGDNRKIRVFLILNQLSKDALLFKGLKYENTSCRNNPPVKKLELKDMSYNIDRF